MPFWRRARLVSTMIVVLVTTFSGQSHAISGQECTPTFVETLGFQPASNGTGIYRETNKLAWSPNGQLLAVGARREHRVDIQVWNVEQNELIKILAPDTMADFLDIEGNNGIGMAWSPDSEKVAVAFSDATVRVWNAAKAWEMITLEVGVNTSYFVAWSPDSRKLVTVDSDLQVRLWNAENGELVGMLPNIQFGYITTTPDAWYIAGLTGEGVDVQNLTTGEVLLTVDTPHLLDIAWSDEVQVVATLELGDDQDEIAVWDVQTQELLRRIVDESIFPFPSDLSPDGKTLVIVNDTGARFISISSGRELYKLEEMPVNRRPLWSPNGRCVVWSYTLPDEANVRTVMIAPYAQESVQLNIDTNGLAFSPDSTMIATTDDSGTITIWRVGQGE